MISVFMSFRFREGANNNIISIPILAPGTFLFPLNRCLQRIKLDIENEYAVRSRRVLTHLFEDERVYLVLHSISVILEHATQNALISVTFNTLCNVLDAQIN